MDIDLDFSTKHRKRRKKKRNIVLEVMLWIFEIIACIALAYLATNLMFEKTVMNGRSMEKLISDKDTIVVNKISYLFSGPKRFDVIVYKEVSEGHEYYEIKRVIGLPGENVLISDGKIYINGVELSNVVDTEALKIAGLAENGVTLKENEYFVLGDNRNYSEDSRYATVGNIMREDIVGKAFVRIKPFKFLNIRA